MVRVLKRKNNILPKRTCAIYAICVLCFLAVMTLQIIYIFPLDQPMGGHDAGYHYLRTEAIKHRIEEGSFFNGGVDYLFYNGAGYASSLAYPDLLLYIPALLRVAGVGIGTSMSVFVIICNILCYLSMFICVRKISGSAVCGTIAAVVFSLSQYRIDNVFTRFALGEIQSYIFWPIIIYGLYDLIFDGFKKPYVIGLGIGGMLLTHSISTVIALGLCVFMFIIFIKRIVKSVPPPRKTFIKLFLTALSVVAITAFYWMPLLEFMLSCELTVAHPREIASDFVIEFFNLFRDIPIAYSNAGMGILIFALCIPRIALCKNSPVYKSLKISETDKKCPRILLAADVFMIIGFLLCLITTNLAPWKILAPVFDFMQYPWRLFALAATLISIAAAIFIYILSDYTKAQITAMIVVTTAAILSACLHLNTISPYHDDKLPDNHYEYSENTFNISFGEWVPWAAHNNIDIVKTLTDTLTLDNGNEVGFGRRNGLLKFTLPEEGAEYADIPFIWYKGYTAIDETGQELETSMNDLGMLRVNTINAKGEITVEFKLTFIKIISPLISLASVLLIAVIFIYKKIQIKKRVYAESNIKIESEVLKNSEAPKESDDLEASENYENIDKSEISEGLKDSDNLNNSSPTT